MLHYGTASGLYTKFTDVGNTAIYTISGLTPSVTYFFAVTAYDQFKMEGDYSDEVPCVAPNHGPTISKIVDQVTQVSVATPALPFSVGDMETPADGLVVMGFSSNPSLVPVSRIQLGGSGSNRTVKVTPIADRIGEATITLRVDAGNGGSATNSFGLKVNPIGAGPTLDAIADVTTGDNAGLQTVALTGISSGATNGLGLLPATVVAFSSDQSLIPDPVVAYKNPQQIGTLSFTNVPGQNGTALITVMVSASPNALNGLIPITIVRSFTVNVTAAPPNYVPTLDPISNRTLLQDAGPQIITLTGISSGTTNETQNLALAASSSNPDLIPTPHIQYGTLGPVGTLFFTPAAHATGSSTITVVMQDGGGVAQGGRLSQTNHSFVVTILPLPELRIEPSGNEVHLSWPASRSGFILEWTESLFPPKWNPVLDLAQSQNTLALRATEVSRFFRLRKP